MPFIGTDGALLPSKNPYLEEAAKAGFVEFIKQCQPVNEEVGSEFTNWNELELEAKEVWLRIAAAAIDAYDDAEETGK